MDDAEFEEALHRRFPTTKYRHPRHWKNSAFNNPSQPVVGVCLHEVKAYCKWLSAQTGQYFRLPSEYEWEAAARGFEGRVYAYGNVYEELSSNILDTHIGRTTPIGIFSSGDTLEGVSDMMGNCWEWTTSIYEPYVDMTTLEREIDTSKIVRRGSCFNGDKKIKASSRYWNSPNRRNDYLGFRLVCAI